MIPNNALSTLQPFGPHHSHICLLNNLLYLIEDVVYAHERYKNAANKEHAFVFV